MEAVESSKMLIAIKVGIIFILFTPLIFGPFGLSFSEYPKTAYFRTLTVLISILWLIFIMSAKRRTDSWNMPRITWLTILVLLSFVSMIFSSLLGFNIQRSLWGGLETGGGLITHFHYIVFFIILTAVIKEKHEWLRLLRAIILVSLLSTMAGFLQKAGVAEFYGVGVQAAGRISGTLSNPVYYGFFMVIAIFLGIYLASLEKDRLSKFLWGIISALNFIGIIMSGSRAALFGLGFGFALLSFFILFFLLRQNAALRKKILIAGLALSIFLAVSVRILPESVFSEGLLTARFISALSPSSFEGRFPGWETAWRAWQDRKLFGWGAESFGFLYYKYFDAHFSRHINAYYVFDDAHNKILNLMAETGIVGASIYIAIFVLIFTVLWKNRYKAGELQAFILITFFASYFFQNLFAFDTASTYVIFFLMLAFVNNTHEFKCLKWHFKQGSLIKTGCAFLIFILALYLYFMNLKPALASYDFVKGFFIERTDFSKSLNHYHRGIGRGTPYNKELKIVMISREILALEDGFGKQWEQEILRDLAAARPFLLESLEIPDSRYLNSVELLARTDEWLYMATKDPKLLTEAEGAVKKGLDFNNQWMSLYYLAGKFSIYRGEYEQGENLFGQGYSFSLGTPEDAFEMRRNMGVAYWRRGDNSKAADNFKKAVEIKLSARGVRQGIKNERPDCGVSPEELYSWRQDTSRDILFIEATALLLLETGNKESAQEIYRMAIDSYCPHADRLKAGLQRMVQQP